MTQTEAAEMMGSGGPYRHPGLEQLRLLPVSVDAATESVRNLERQQLVFVGVLPESGAGAGGTAAAPPPRRHDPNLPADFSLPPWHLLGGLNASSAATSSANRSTLLSIAPASPVVAQVPDSAFVNAAENLFSQPVTFVVSRGRALAAAFEWTLSRQPAFLPAAFIL